MSRKHRSSRHRAPAEQVAPPAAAGVPPPGLRARPLLLACSAAAFALWMAALLAMYFTTVRR